MFEPVYWVMGFSIGLALGMGIPLRLRRGASMTFKEGTPTFRSGFRSVQLEHDVAEEVHRMLAPTRSCGCACKTNHAITYD